VAIVFEREEQSLQLQRPNRHLSVCKLYFKPREKRETFRIDRAGSKTSHTIFEVHNEKLGNPAERTTTICNNPGTG
jgi:hypothetical protein